jgi:hypothetical protein
MWYLRTLARNTLVDIADEQKHSEGKKHEIVESAKPRASGIIQVDPIPIMQHTSESSTVVATPTAFRADSSPAITPLNLIPHPAPSNYRGRPDRLFHPGMPRSRLLLRQRDQMQKWLFNPTQRNPTKPSVTCWERLGVRLAVENQERPRLM